MSVKVFISYKTGSDSSFKANTLVNEFERRGYSVWLDQRQIDGGEDWSREIYEAIPRSDVLLLLLSAKAIDSEWVRREVDVAKGAQVAILPLLIEDGLNPQPIQDKFDIPKLQYMTYLKADEVELAKLATRIEELGKETQERRREWFESLMEGQAKPVFKKNLEAKRSVKRYKLDEHWDGCRIHLATGDVTEIAGIDVLINPENSYMQMARVFDTASVSSAVRYQGSGMRNNGQIHEDSIHRELSDQITFNPNDYGLPIATGRVVPTTAGHPKSELRDMGYKYVLHVVTVTVNMGAERENRLVPISNDRVDTAVKTVCRMVMTINEHEGVISPADTPAYKHTVEVKENGNYRPMKSVIFPMFATGRGGRETDVEQIAEELVNAIKKYLRRYKDREHFTLNDVHLCAFSEGDRQTIQAVMDRNLVAD